MLSCQRGILYIYVLVGLYLSMMSQKASCQSAGMKKDFRQRRNRLIVHRGKLCVPESVLSKAAVASFGSHRGHKPLLTPSIPLYVNFSIYSLRTNMYAL